MAVARARASNYTVLRWARAGTIIDWVGLAVARGRASNSKVGKGDPTRGGWVWL